MAGYLKHRHPAVMAAALVARCGVATGTGASGDVGSAGNPAPVTAAALQCPLRRCLRCCEGRTAARMLG